MEKTEYVITIETNRGHYKEMAFESRAEMDAKFNELKELGLSVGLETKATDDEN